MVLILHNPVYSASEIGIARLGQWSMVFQNIFRIPKFSYITTTWDDRPNAVTCPFFTLVRFRHARSRNSLHPFPRRLFISFSFAQATNKQNERTFNYRGFGMAEALGSSGRTLIEAGWGSAPSAVWLELHGRGP